MKNMVKNKIVLHDPYSDARCLPNLTQLSIFIIREMKKMVKNEIVLHDPYSDARCLPKLT